MIDPVLTQILVQSFTYGLCGSLAAAVAWFFNRGESRPRLDQAAAVGFLVGGAFGATFGIFRSMMVP